MKASSFFIKGLLNTSKALSQLGTGFIQQGVVYTGFTQLKNKDVEVYPAPKGQLYNVYCINGVLYDKNSKVIEDPNITLVCRTYQCDGKCIMIDITTRYNVLCTYKFVPDTEQYYLMGMGDHNKKIIKEKNKETKYKLENKNKLEEIKKPKAVRIERKPEPVEVVVGGAKKSKPIDEVKLEKRAKNQEKKTLMERAEISKQVRKRAAKARHQKNTEIKK